MNTRDRNLTRTSCAINAARDSVWLVSRDQAEPCAVTPDVSSYRVREVSPNNQRASVGEPLDQIRPW